MQANGLCHFTLGLWTLNFFQKIPIQELIKISKILVEGMFRNFQELRTELQFLGIKFNLAVGK